MLNEKQKYLQKLLVNNSKHSHYQAIPNSLNQLDIFKDYKVHSRFERERMEFILTNINPEKTKICDIGGNTGYFTFEFIENEALGVDYYEGNKEHALFVSTAALLTGNQDKIKVHNQYYNFEDYNKNNYDITLCLNVLHHYGDDFGNKELSINEVKNNIGKFINQLSANSKYLVLQIGFNWKGNVNLSLFKNGTKAEMIELIKSVTKEKWDIHSIGIPEVIKDEISYRPLSDSNIERSDKLGEFLNRPLFILKSKMVTQTKG